MYHYIPPNNRKKLGKNLVDFLKDKGCQPYDVLHRISNKYKQGGFHLREIIDSNEPPFRAKNYAKSEITKNRGIAYLGKGKQGIVYIGCIDRDCKKEVAIKMGENLKSEYEIMKKISAMSPHVVTPYNYVKCKDRDIIYMEYFKGGSLYSWRKNKITLEQYRNVIFQIIFTLFQILSKYPKFRHYDLHLENILIDDMCLSHKGKIQYIIDGKSYYIDPLGINPVIADFGIANHKGTPHMKRNGGIGEGSDYRYDIHVFLNSLYGRPFLPFEVRQFIEDLLPQEYLGSLPTSKIKNYRLRHGVDHSKLPTKKQILNHPFFDPLKIPTNNILNIFSANNNKQNMVAKKRWANYTGNESLSPIEGLERQWHLGNIKQFNTSKLRKVACPKPRPKPPQKKSKKPKLLKLNKGPARVTQAVKPRSFTNHTLPGAAIKLNATERAAARRLANQLQALNQALETNQALHLAFEKQKQIKRKQKTKNILSKFLLQRQMKNAGLVNSLSSPSPNEFKEIFGVTFAEFNKQKLPVNEEKFSEVLVKVKETATKAKNARPAVKVHTVGEPVYSPTKEVKKKQKRCKKGFHRNPATGECEAVGPDGLAPFERPSRHKPHKNAINVKLGKMAVQRKTSTKVNTSKAALKQRQENARNFMAKERVKQALAALDAPAPSKTTGFVAAKVKNIPARARAPTSAINSSFIDRMLLGRAAPLAPTPAARGIRRSPPPAPPVSVPKRKNPPAASSLAAIKAVAAQYKTGAQAARNAYKK